MKLAIAALLFTMCSFLVHAQTPLPIPASAVTTTTAPIIVAAAIDAAPAKQPAQPLQVIIDILTALEKFPVVGPVVSKAVQYLAIFGSFTTLLTGFLMGLIKLLGPKIASGTALEIEQKVVDALNSPVIQWLRWASFLQKAAPVEPKAPVATAVVTPPPAA